MVTTAPSIDIMSSNAGMVVSPLAYLRHHACETEISR
jgi:hypothetical protein